MLSGPLLLCKGDCLAGPRKHATRRLTSTVVLHRGRTPSLAQIIVAQLPIEDLQLEPLLSSISLVIWEAAHVPAKKARIYAHRIAGGHRHHCHSDRAVGAGGAKGPRGGGARPVPEQPQADRSGPAQLSRHQ